MTSTDKLARWLTTGLCLLLATSMTAAAADEESVETLPKNLKVISLEAYPDQVELDNPFAYRQLLLTATLKTGETVDLTRMVKLESNPTVVSVSKNGLVRPLTNGSEELAFRFGRFKINVPVEVSNLEVARPVSFVQDV
ncbi:MAG: hypothetical protein VB855_02330, partial [Pirellulaceae bacterium]